MEDMFSPVNAHLVGTTKVRFEEVLAEIKEWTSEEFDNGKLFLERDGRMIGFVSRTEDGTRIAWYLSRRFYLGHCRGNTVRDIAEALEECSVFDPDTPVESLPLRNLADRVGVEPGDVSWDGSMLAFRMPDGGLYEAKDVNCLKVHVGGGVFVVRVVPREGAVPIHQRKEAG